MSDKFLVTSDFFLVNGSALENLYIVMAFKDQTCIIHGCLQLTDSDQERFLLASCVVGQGLCKVQHN